MKDKRVRETILRWMLPFLTLMVIIIILLAKYFYSTSLKERSEVEAKFIQNVAAYEKKLGKSMDIMNRSGDLMAQMLKDNFDINSKETKNGIKSLCDFTDSYMAVICNEEGVGFAWGTGIEDAARVDLKYVEYFEEISLYNHKFIYIEDDKIVGKSAIVCSTTIRRNNDVVGYIVQYYNVSNLNQIIRKMEFGLDSVYFLVDGDGNKVAAVGNTTDVLASGGNLWEDLNKGVKEADLVATLKDEISQRNTGSLYMEIDNREMIVIYAPSGVSNWYIVAVVKKAYVDKQVENEWKQARSLVILFTIAILIFLGTLVGINLSSKLKTVEDSKLLEDKADTDLLTDLYNKMASERKVKEYINKNPEGRGILFLIDVDNFKKINDTMGHAFGDEVLKGIGLQIKAEFRTTDILGRVGGDEFLIFLKNVDENISQDVAAQKAIRVFKNFQAGEYVKYSATGSIGAAIYPTDAKDFEGLYKAADRALYKAKRRGKNQLAFCQDEMEIN